MLENTNLINAQKQIIFTDGSAASICKNKKDKHARGGYSVLFVDGPIKNKVLLGNLDTTISFASNIRAEGMAIIASLETCSDLIEQTEIEIYTDSEFWIKMISTYMPAWEKKKIDFNIKKNPDLTTYLWKLWKAINLQHKIKLVHVYAHNKSGWKTSKNKFEKMCYDNNELADKFAEEARKDLKIGQQVWRDL